MRRSRAVELALLVAIAGCEVRASIGLGIDPHTLKEVAAPLAFGANDDIDVLFVIDNSPGMAPKQALLEQALATFGNQLDALSGLHLHFSMVTTDLGAGSLALGECAPLGDGALLFSIGRAAPADCPAPHDRYLDVDQVNAKSNLPTGRSLGQTLACIAAAGDTGCGFQQPLEAAMRALSGDVAANDGFLRDSARLVVVFVTDEDDCSGPPDSPIYDPMTSEPFDHFRCFAAAVRCGDPPAPPSASSLPLGGCTPAPGGRLYDLSRYADFFFGPRGVKANPNDVRLVVLSGPDDPVIIEPDRTLHPSCTTLGDASFTAFPSLRVHTLAALSPRSVTASICGAGSAEFLLGNIATDFASSDATAACLPAPIDDPSAPDCQLLAGDQPVPSCASTAGRTPCWDLVTNPSCFPLYNPRTRHTEQLALTLRPAVALAAPLSGACRVIVPAE